MESKKNTTKFIDNPIWMSLKRTRNQFRELDFSFSNYIPSILVMVILLAVIIIQIILLPYGCILVIADFLWKLVKIALQDLQKQKGTSFIEKIPYTVTFGFYFIIWLPFAIICLPFAVIGYMGEWISTWR